VGIMGKREPVEGKAIIPELTGNPFSAREKWSSNKEMVTLGYPEEVSSLFGVAMI